AALLSFALVAPVTAESPSGFAINSTAFEANGGIPQKFTCEGKDFSPPLAWSGAPAATKSFALIVDDPDAPAGTWVHWVVFEIPAVTKQFVEGASAGRLPAGAREGRNSWGKSGYGGPCPPSGRHHYVHKLFALDVTLNKLRDPDAAALERAMQDHVL